MLETPVYIMKPVRQTKVALSPIVVVQEALSDIHEPIKHFIIWGISTWPSQSSLKCASRNSNLALGAQRLKAVAMPSNVGATLVPRWYGRKSTRKPLLVSYGRELPSSLWLHKAHENAASKKQAFECLYVHNICIFIYICMYLINMK